jgi:NAD(P)-dependent dehydrogenase (short-subunit alcohol dehydrogenase family)
MSARCESARMSHEPSKGRVAVVTRASRGAGRAIAAVLGEHGATVYVTGRSVRGQPTTDNLPGTIEDSAEEVTRRGGQGIAVHCDHANERETEALFQRLREEQGTLNTLVNNAWGGLRKGAPDSSLLLAGAAAPLGCDV